MKWLVLGLLLFLCVWLVQRRRSRLLQLIGSDEFAYWIRCLITVKEDGGALTIRDQKSGAMVRLGRARSDSDSSCELFLDIPRTSWSETMRDAIVEFLEGKRLSFLEPDDRMDVLLRVPFRIPNIWDEGAGLAASRTTQELLVAVGVPREARFDVRTSGPNSVRLLQRKAPSWIEGDSLVLKSVAKKVSKDGSDENRTKWGSGEP